jgi:hypothetical protein
MINLEQLADGSISDRNFQKLMSLVPDSGGQTVGFRFGETSVTYPGASQSATLKTVAHGLGRIPVVVFTQAFNTTVHLAEPHSKDATNIQITTATRDESSPAGGTTAAVFWLVIG